MQKQKILFNQIVKLIIYNVFKLKKIGCTSEEFIKMLVIIKQKQFENLIFDKYKKNYFLIKEKYSV